MSSQPANYLTPEQYLEIERRAERRSEYYKGEMFAMAGATREHILIVTNLVRQLDERLDAKGCEVYSNDMRLRISPTGLYTYPEVVVACSEPHFADDQRDTLLNPIVVVEVLSESTRDYDRGEKFEHYRTLPSLLEYLTVAQDRVHVEQWSRRDDGWHLTEYQDPSQEVRLTPIDVALPVGSHKVAFAR